MYGRPSSNQTNNSPPPWLVRAEVTIRHPVTPGSDQTPLQGSSTTVTDTNGVRMVYRWNSSQPSNVPLISTTSSGVQTSTSSSFGFQRGNIFFTSTPPPRPASAGSFTVPRTRQTSEESVRARNTNVPDSGYNSEFSPQSYSSLPPQARRPSQQYNRRCKSTCSIVLSTGPAEDRERKAEAERSEKVKGGSLFRPSHQHVFPRYHFSTVPEACEDCAEAGGSTGFTTHFCTRVTEKNLSKPAKVSKDASSQTTDVETRPPGSTEGREKGGDPSGERKEAKETREHSPPRSKEEASSRRKSRTVHIDVYCTGSDDNGSSDSSSETELDTPATVFESPEVKVTHTQSRASDPPRGFQDENAFLRRTSERRSENLRNAPIRMPSLASSKGYESDDLLSSLYPSQFSSYSAIRDLDSTPWSAASSSNAIPFDYDSTIATSSKDTFSDVESLANSRASLTPCDSFEYANSSDRERIRKMEAIWARADSEKRKNWRSPQIERRHLLQNRKMREFLEKHEIGWSSGESDSDESVAAGWSFVSRGNVLRKDSTVRRASKEVAKVAESGVEQGETEKRVQEERSDSTNRSEFIPHSLLREQIGPFGSKSPSPLPSKVPSRVTSPFTTPQGEKTEHIAKASIFGAVVGAFRKPGHHIGPSKNPGCSCEHCRRHFEEMEACRGFGREAK